MLVPLHTVSCVFAGGCHGSFKGQGCFGATVTLGLPLRKITPVLYKENSTERPPNNQGVCWAPLFDFFSPLLR